jgi:hypothetical protein
MNSCLERSEAKWWEIELLTVGLNRQGYVEEPASMDEDETNHLHNPLVVQCAPSPVRRINRRRRDHTDAE